MPAANADILRLRRMINELDSTTYSNDLLASYLEAWPLVDDEGRTFEHDEWTEAYDLHATAAELWEEKAASLQIKHDFSADGASYSSSQMYDMAMDQARFHHARQRAKTRRVFKHPVEANSDLYAGYIANIDVSGEDDSPFSLWDDAGENIP